MVSVFAFQDYYSGNSSWKNQVLNNTLSVYEAGNTILDATVGSLAVILGASR